MSQIDKQGLSEEQKIREIVDLCREYVVNWEDFDLLEDKLKPILSQAIVKAKEAQRLAFIKIVESKKIRFKYGYGYTNGLSKDFGDGYNEALDDIIKELDVKRANTN